MYCILHTKLCICVLGTVKSLVLHSKNSQIRSHCFAIVKEYKYCKTVHLLLGPLRNMLHEPLLPLCLKGIKTITSPKRNVRHAGVNVGVNVSDPM